MSDAPISAPGIEPIAIAIPATKSTFPCRVCVITPGIARITNAIKLVPEAFFIVMPSSDGRNWYSQ